MKRYFREEGGDLYDRKTGFMIIVKIEKRIGDRYYINEGAEQKVIWIEDVEEVR